MKRLPQVVSSTVVLTATRPKYKDLTQLLFLQGAGRGHLDERRAGILTACERVAVWRCSSDPNGKKGV